MRLLLFAVVGVVLRGLLRVRSLPPNRPAKFTGTGPVVCLGASTVQGNISYDWVSELGRRLPGQEFVNAGVNGDTSGQVLARVPSVVACRPSTVIVMVGANDLFAIRGAKLADGRRTTFAEYEENLTAIVRALRPARVALLSVQPLGELLDSPENRDMDRVNAVVRKVAEAEGVTYLPFAERLKEIVGGGGAPFRDSPLPVFRAIVLHLGLGVPLDRIGRWHGFLAHTEGLHLASRGGLIAADLAEGFVRSAG